MTNNSSPALRVVTPVHFFIYTLGLLDILILIVKPFIIEPEVQFFTILLLILWLVLFSILFPPPTSTLYLPTQAFKNFNNRKFNKILFFSFIALTLISLSISQFYGDITWLDPELYQSGYYRYLNYQLSLSSLIKNTTPLQRLFPSLGNAVLFTASAYLIKVLFSSNKIFLGFVFYIPYAGFSYVRGTFFQLASLVVFSLIGFLASHPLLINPNLFKLPKQLVKTFALFLFSFIIFVSLFYINHTLRHVAGPEAVDLTRENFVLRPEIIADIHHKIIPSNIMHILLLASVYITFPFMQFSRLILVGISNLDFNILLFPLLNHPQNIGDMSLNSFISSAISSDNLLSISPHVSILVTLSAFLGIPLALLFLYPYIRLVLYAQKLSLSHPFGIIQIVSPLLIFSVLCIYMNEFVFLPSVRFVFSLSLFFVIFKLFRSSLSRSRI